MRNVRPLAILLGLILIVSTASGQPAFLQQRSWEIAGTASYSTYMVNDYKVTRIRISPSIQYFLSPRLSAGGKLTYWSDKDDYSSSEFSIGPLVTWYPVQFERGAVFLGVGALVSNYSYEAYGYDSNGNYTGNQTIKNDGYTIDAGGGYISALNENAGITSEVFYTYSEYDKTPLREWGARLGLAVFFSMYGY